MIKDLFKLPLLLIFSIFLSACGTSTNNMYYWKGYNNTVYDYLKNDSTSISNQIETMEKYFSDAKDKQLAIAPGAHAHMGLLLVQSGQLDAARQQFLEEKKLFPESSSYINFLMKNKVNGEQK
ncbi:DUF4810 domain-containing protein [Avibacterium paragallinarum]|uniref:DUF4810 domain-containing protein n=1 Tax=Avibacterium paragallinarum TaxID=728 RepID=UPI0021F79684|nr:DUF4810 domain-containing protein [Avibacterium paragallinarum]UXN35988.1 DUF4810 domain-containing protein [Avibacterium paragallinarum]